MFLGFLTLITALSISAVAIYYSVAGLVTIFSAAAIPIMIMGSALEIGKLVTAVWLHRYWKQTVWWLKTYLSIAVIVLMFITSIGIFGFLSRAHIEQTANVAEITETIARVESDIERKNQAIARAEETISEAQSRTRNQETDIQQQIDREQARIDSAYQRIQPAIDEQNSIIAREEQRLGGGVALYQEQIATIDRNLRSIEENIGAGNVEAVQALVGVRADGNLGPATQRAIEAYRATQTAERQRLSELIASESRNITSPVIDAARAEIQRLRGLAEQEIADSNALISRLRTQIGIDNSQEVEQIVSEQEQIIATTRQEIESLIDRKFQLETEYRLFEAEVGPIKYIAEFIYGDVDKNLLEEAVRWLIVIIIFVFDPLAVLLLVASQYTFEMHRKEKSNKLLEEKNELPNRTNEQEQPDPEFKLPEISELERGLSVEEPKTDATVSGTGHEERDSELERSRELEELESSDDYKSAKQRWKDDHPEETLKEWKDKYIKGEVDQLPWNGYVQNAEQGTNSIWNRIKNRNE
jgi:hypothetical protein